jgi:hypothetical protein
MKPPPTDILGAMLKRAGKDPRSLSLRTAVGKAIRGRGVSKSPEFERVFHLPRRVWQDDPELEAFAAELTEALRTPAGTMTLRPVQAYCLQELYLFGGLFAPIRCGGGKTLLSALCAAILGLKTLVVVPAKLVGKTRDDFEELCEHWQIPLDLISITSYTKLGRVSGKTYLEDNQFKLLVFDEGHKLKNRHAAVTRVVRRFVKAFAPIVVIMSGTITTRSLHDYHHLLKWALPRLMPLPVHEMEMRDWADALDEKVEPLRRMRPGALEAFYNQEEKKLEPLVAARRAYGRRLTETPGVVATQEGHCGATLTLATLPVRFAETSVAHEIPCVACEQKGCSLCTGRGFFRYTVDVRGAFDRLRERGETPDGHPAPDRVSVWRHTGEFACGLFYRWNPYPPSWWLIPRRAWAKFARDTISHNRRGIDSVKQVAMAYPNAPELLAWKQVSGKFKPKVEAVWIDDGPLRTAAAWAAKAPGLVWTMHVAFGKRLAQLTGLPFCHENGCDAKGIRADRHPGSVICSVDSIGEGFNMQMYNRNLIVSAHPNGKIWEQMLSRTHRDGQLEDEVTVEVMLSCREQVAGFEQARRDCEAYQDTFRQAQKLCNADILIDESSIVL